MRNILTNPGRCDRMTVGGDRMAQTKEERLEKQKECHRRNGYAAQKKFKKKMYECRFYIKPEYKDALQKIADEKGVALSRLFVDAAEEKYGIKLRENS